jgi:hypothetical protein
MTKARDLANAGTGFTIVSATELGYLDGTTSAVQTQIDSKIGQSTAINPTVVDAKGDIIAATSADTVARLAVGSNDTVLTADSSTATGLKWAAPAGGAAYVGAFAKKTSTQSLTNETLTAITFTGEEFDTDAFHDNSTNTSRFTIPAGKGGKYLITGTIFFASSNLGQRLLYIYKNGSFYWELAEVHASQAKRTGCIYNQVLALSASDYIEIFALQGTGGTLNVSGDSTNTSLQITYLGA